MRIYLIEVYNEKTNWKVQSVKKKLGIKLADMFRAGVNLYLDKLESEGAVSFSDEEFDEYMKKKRDSENLG